MTAEVVTLPTALLWEHAHANFAPAFILQGEKQQRPHWRRGMSVPSVTSGNDPRGFWAEPGRACGGESPL